MNLIQFCLANILVSLLDARQWPAHPRCFEVANPLNPSNMTQVPCEWDRPNIQRRAPSIGDSPILIKMSCSDATGKCDKVKQAFNKAAQVLSSFIDFKAQIIIDAKFHSFCTVDKLCPSRTEGGMILGMAAPANVITVVDNDNVERLYPQALAKQLDMPSNEVARFKLNDITASFNSDAKWWFEGEGKIGSNQYDFFSIIAHELMHGLGFASSLNTWFDSNTDFISPTPSYERRSGSSEFRLAAFSPTALDRLIVTSDGKEIQKLLEPFIKFTSNDKVRSETQLVSLLEKSSLKSHSDKLYQLSTTANSLAVVLPKGDSLILETSYKTFESGSSVSHLSGTKYTGTQESLMMAKVKSGYSFLATGSATEWDTAPYGPQLVAVLAELGYPVKGFTRTEPLPGSSSGGSYKKPSGGGGGSNNANQLTMNLGFMSLILLSYIYFN